MPSPNIQKVRLAVVGTPAPETFNFYQAFSVFSSLYFKAGDREDVKENKVGWDDASHSLLIQVGKAFAILETAQASAKDQIPLEPNPTLTERGARLARRMVVCEENLTIWTSNVRWARILLLLETKLKKLSIELSEYNPYVSKEVLALTELGAERRAFVTKLAEESRSDAVSLQANFAIPKAM